MAIEIRKIALPIPGVELLLAEAKKEGFDFVEALIEHWETGENRFDAPGEILCGCFNGSQLVAVGGLNLDPFAGSLEVGRIRRIYVRPTWRNRGIGRSLVALLVEHARTHFSCVRLRAENAGAARLYESLGFVPIENPDATHLLSFNKPE